MAEQTSQSRCRLLIADGDPAIQGLEFVRYMKTEKRLMKIPVIRMMTAEQNPKHLPESFGAVAVVFLPKPFTASQL